MCQLDPFWQFLSEGVSSVAEDANIEWGKNSSIYPPNYILGYYGTDRGDNLDLGYLNNICYDDGTPLYYLSFNELDLECRTSPFPITGEDNNYPLHNLWYQHFHYKTREETLKSLGELADTVIKDWGEEIRSLLHLERMTHKETWT
jgi:hypothetical protein